MVGSGVPLVRQFNQTDCGPASLLTVLRIYGGESSLAAMRNYCATGKDGTGLGDLKRAAEYCGFQAKAVQGTLDDLAGETLPCIAHVQRKGVGSHFLVVLSVGRSHIRVADPGKGVKRVKRKDFAEEWSGGIALLLHPGDNLLREQNPSEFRLVRDMILDHRIWLLQSVFLGILISAGGLFSAWVLQITVDRIIPSGTAGTLIPILTALAAVMAVKTAASYLRLAVLADFTETFNNSLHGKFLSHLLKLPASYFMTRRTGDLTTRFQDSLRIQRGIVQISNDMLIQGLILIVSIIYFISIEPILAAVTALILGLYALSAARHLPLLRSLNLQVMHSYSGVESAYIDMIRGEKSIRLSDAGSSFSGRNRVLFRVFQSLQKKLSLTAAGYGASVEAVSVLLNLSFLGLGAGLVMNDALKLGELMGSYSLLGSMIPALHGLMGNIGDIQNSRAALGRLNDVLTSPSEDTDGSPVFSPVSDYIHCEKLSFRYPRNESPLIFPPFFLKRGVLNIVTGQNGSGKSTLSAILSGIIQPGAGRIMTDETDRRNLDSLLLRRLVRLVPQDHYIFNMSLGENILMGLKDANEHSLSEFTEKIGLQRFFSRFQDGPQTYLGEDGQRLSGGERFMVCLFRAMIAEPEVLIIDEGLESLDHDCGTWIRSLLKQYSEDHFTVVITHRPPAADDLNHIIHLGGNNVSKYRKR